jgi:hypothetical protein
VSMLPMLLLILTIMLAAIEAFVIRNTLILYRAVARQTISPVLLHDDDAGVAP